MPVLVRMAPNVSINCVRSLMYSQRWRIPPHLSSLLQFLSWSIANFNFNVLKCWPTFPDWILVALHEADEEAPSQLSVPAWRFHLPSAACWFPESAMDLLYVHGGHLEYFNCNNTGCTDTVMAWDRHFFKVRTTLALLVTVWWAHLIKKRAPNCVFLFPEGYLLVVYSTSLPLLAQMSIPYVPLFLPLYLFITPFSSGGLIVSACSLAILVAARLIVYFAETAKLLFFYALLSLWVFFFPSHFSFLTHVFHHQPSCPQHNPAESYKMSILNEGGGETEQAW